MLFFEKGKPTKKVWYYQLNVGRSLGKTNSLNDSDLSDFIELAKTKEISKNSWLVDIGLVNNENWDLTVSNPNTIEEVDNRTPQEIITEIEKLDLQAAESLRKIRELL